MRSASADGARFGIDGVADEGEFAVNDLAGEGGDFGFHQLAFGEFAGVLFGNIGDEPDLGKVGDFKDGVGGLHHLAEGGLAGEDGAIHTGDDAGDRVNAAGLLQFVDGFRRHAEQRQLIARGVEFGAGLHEFGFAALQFGRADDIGVEQDLRAFDGALGHLLLRQRFEETQLGIGKAGAVELGEHFAFLDILAFVCADRIDAAHDGRANAGDAGFIDFDAGGDGDAGADFGGDGLADLEAAAHVGRGCDLHGIGRRGSRGRRGGGGRRILAIAAGHNGDGGEQEDGNRPIHGTVFRNSTARNSSRSTRAA